MEPTPEQQKILASDATSILTIAGAGTGKTTTLIAYLQRKAAQLGRTDGFVIITYTNEAAQHLLRRLGSSFRPRFCGTLHAWSLFEIRQLEKRQWAVLDEATADERIREAMAAHCYTGTLAEIRRALTDESTASAAAIVAKSYREKMLAEHCLDFDMILAKWRDLLRYTGGPALDVLAVDEYQDTAPIDAEIYSHTRALFRFVVGDPDQTIYTFRGANIANILALAETTEVHKLTTNWRSGAAICEAANRLIERNANRLPKMLVPGHPDRAGHLDTPPPFDNEADEANHVAAYARQLVRAGKSVGILARTNAAVDFLRATLPEANAEQKQPVEVAILLGALNALIDPENQLAASAWVRHMANTTPRFKEGAAAADLSPLAYAQKITKTSPASATVARLRVMKVPPAAITWAVLAGVQLAKTAAEAYESAIQAITTEHTAGSTGAPIDILTFHGAKGREWDHVIIAAAEAELTPGQKKGSELEEERRLFFVAVTRARFAATITSARSRRNAYNKNIEAHTPTRFIAELQATK